MTLLTTTLRRSLWLILIAAAGGAVWSWRRDAADAATPAPAEWPPLKATPAPATSAAATPAPKPEPAPEPEPASPAESVGWVEPLADGSCPDGYPIKANHSGIFHVPDGRSYERTKPQRCYSNADAAIADGYRAAKN